MILDCNQTLVVGLVISTRKCGSVSRGLTVIISASLFTNLVYATTHLLHRHWHLSKQCFTYSGSFCYISGNTV